MYWHNSFCNKPSYFLKPDITQIAKRFLQAWWILVWRKWKCIYQVLLQTWIIIISKWWYVSEPCLTRNHLRFLFYYTKLLQQLFMAYVYEPFYIYWNTQDRISLHSQNCSLNKNLQGEYNGKWVSYYTSFSWKTCILWWEICFYSTYLLLKNKIIHHII